MKVDRIPGKGVSSTVNGKSLAFHRQSSRSVEIGWESINKPLRAQVHYRCQLGSISEKAL